MLHVDLTQLAGGELQEKFDREITRVVENMQDPNTPFLAKRKITIDISLQSKNEYRDDANIEISVKSKLAGVIPAKTNFAMGKDLQSGKVIVKEYGKQVPGQMSFSDMPETEDETESKPKIAAMPRVLKANE